jgi:hypothetical protein
MVPGLGGEPLPGGLGQISAILCQLTTVPGYRQRRRGRRHGRKMESYRGLGMTGSVQRYFRIIASALAWFALLLQYGLTIAEPGAVLVEATVRYFSFFTILTNILVALALTLPWLAPATKLGRFFERPSVRTAILTYIIIVAVIYHYLLAKLWHPQGWEFIADTIEHVVTPALYVIDWVLFVPKGTVRWTSALVWLGYPLVYAVYSLIHGAVSGFYPYPFLNVSKFGYDEIFLNMGVLVLVFLGLGVALIGLDRRMGRNNNAKTSSTA